MNWPRVFARPDKDVLSPRRFLRGWKRHCVREPGWSQSRNSPCFALIGTISDGRWCIRVAKSTTSETDVTSADAKTPRAKRRGLANWIATSALIAAATAALAAAFFQTSPPVSRAAFDVLVAARLAMGLETSRQPVHVAVLQVEPRQLEIDVLEPVFAKLEATGVAGLAARGPASVTTRLRQAWAGPLALRTSEGEGRLVGARVAQTPRTESLSLDFRRAAASLAPGRSAPAAPATGESLLTTYGPSDVPILRAAALAACADPSAAEAWLRGRVLFLAVEPDESAAAASCETIRLAQPGPRTTRVQAEAAQVESLLSDRRIPKAPLALQAALAAAMAAAAILAAWLARPPEALAIWCALVGVALAASFVAIGFGGRLDPFVPIASTPIAAAFGLLGRRAAQESARKHVEDAFGRYLPIEVLEEFVEGRASVEPGGAVRNIAVMFADLAGFTRLSTQLEPSRLVEVVNRYLAVVVDAVEAHGGYVDKFIGDAVMALWGAPLPDEEAARKAAEATIAVRLAVAEARAIDEGRGETGFGIKIGVASGPAVVGNVGAATRLSYTAIGKTVNIASRLEGLAVAYSCGAVIDPVTAEAARQQLLLRELDRVIVKGAEDPIAVYEPVTTRAEITPDLRRMVDAYSVALARYRARRFEDALKIWSGLADRDGPSAVMAEEARRMILDPPRSTWNAARRMTSK